MKPNTPSQHLTETNAESETELVTRLQAGDQMAYAELVETHAERIYNLALRMLGNPQEAEDVLQETFMNAFRAIHRFEGRSRLSTWLHRIASNAALMRLRKREPIQVSIDEPLALNSGEHLPRQFFDFCCLPEHELLRDEARDEMRVAVDALPEKLRVVFVLRELEGYSTQETADALDLSVSAVKSRLMRARLQLRERLSAYFATASLITETRNS